MRRMKDESDAFWTLAWPHGELSVRAVGGMLAPLRFELGGGRSVSPLYMAPWADEPVASGLSGLMRGLRGEWPCVPFGPAHAPEDLPASWVPRAPTTPWDHGYAANHPWTLVHRDASRLSLRIDLPADEPVAWMERHVCVSGDAPAVSVELVLAARRDAQVPMALHPTFAVPPGGIELRPGAYAAVHAYPIAPERGVSRVLPGCSAESLHALPCIDGTFDATRLPLAFKTEELLQLQDCRPPFVLRYLADEADVLLDWDSPHLPDVLLWVSQCGRGQVPWNSRNQALGVEPCNSCFDLTRAALPPADHPLAHRKGIAMHAGQVLRIGYRLGARN